MRFLKFADPNGQPETSPGEYTGSSVPHMYGGRQRSPMIQPFRSDSTSVVGEGHDRLPS